MTRAPSTRAARVGTPPTHKHYFQREKFNRSEKRVTVYVKKDRDVGWKETLLARAHSARIFRFKYAGESTSWKREDLSGLIFFSSRGPNTRPRTERRRAFDERAL